MENDTSQQAMQSEHNIIRGSAPTKSELIKPMGAVKKLESHVGGSPSAKEILVDKLRDGELKAYAKFAWQIKGVRVKDIWKQVRPDNADCGVLIRREKFLGSLSWKDDLKNWKWNAGDFYCISKQRATIYIFKNVRFLLTDVDTIVAQLLVGVTDAKRPKGGRNSRTDARDDVWLAVLQLLREDGPSSFSPVKAATRKLEQRIKWSSSNKLGGSSITAIITKTRKALSVSRKA